MVRTQIQLTDELAVQIKELAAREHVSMAAMIRTAVAHLLETAPKVGAEDRYVRALSAAGRFRSCRRRLSVEHDSEFAEASRR